MKFIDRLIESVTGTRPTGRAELGKARPDERTGFSPEKMSRREAGSDVSDELQEKAERYLRAEGIVRDYFTKWPSFHFAPHRDIRPENIVAKTEEVQDSYDDLCDAIEELTDLDLPDFEDIETANFDQINKTLQDDYGDLGVKLLGRLETLETAAEELSGRLKVNEKARIARIKASREAVEVQENETEEQKKVA